MTDYMSAEEARALISAAAYRAATELGRAELQSQTIAEYDGFMAAHEAAIRADEREKAAQRVGALRASAKLDENGWSLYEHCYECAGSASGYDTAVDDAIAAARGGEQA